MTFNKSTGIGVRGSGSEAQKSPTQKYFITARDESEGSEAPDSDGGWPCQGIGLLCQCDLGSLKDITLGTDLLTCARGRHLWQECWGWGKGRKSGEQRGWSCFRCVPVRRLYGSSRGKGTNTQGETCLGRREPR